MEATDNRASDDLAVLGEGMSVVTLFLDTLRSAPRSFGILDSLLA
jgi:hypothetical protein